MHVQTALQHVRRRVNMAAGVEPHVDATHDLAQSAGVVLYNLDIELHVLLEAVIGPHVKCLCVEIDAEIDDPRRAVIAREITRLCPSRRVCFHH